MMLQAQHANMEEGETINLMKLPGGQYIVPTPYRTPIIAFRDRRKFEAVMNLFCDPNDCEHPQIDYAGMVVPLIMPDGTAFMLTLLPESLGSIEDDETLWHEMLHCAWFVLNFAGVQLDVHNHEAQTYLMGDLVRKVKEKLYKIK